MYERKYSPERNMVPVKEQNCTISFRADTARGQSSQKPPFENFSLSAAYKPKSHPTWPLESKTSRHAGPGYKQRRLSINKSMNHWNMSRSKFKVCQSIASSNSAGKVIMFEISWFLVKYCFLLESLKGPKIVRKVVSRTGLLTIWGHNHTLPSILVHDLMRAQFHTSITSCTWLNVIFLILYIIFEKVILPCLSSILQLGSMIWIGYDHMILILGTFAWSSHTPDPKSPK